MQAHYLASQLIPQPQPIIFSARLCHMEKCCSDESRDFDSGDEDEESGNEEDSIDSESSTPRMRDRLSVGLCSLCAV